MLLPSVEPTAGGGSTWTRDTGVRRTGSWQDSSRTLWARETGASRDTSTTISGGLELPCTGTTVTTTGATGHGTIPALKYSGTTGWMASLTTAQPGLHDLSQGPGHLRVRRLPLERLGLRICCQIHLRGSSRIGPQSSPTPSCQAVLDLLGVLSLLREQV